MAPFIPLIKVEVQARSGGHLTSIKPNFNLLKRPGGEVRHVTICGWEGLNSKLNTHRFLGHDRVVRQGDVGPRLGGVLTCLNLSVRARPLHPHVVDSRTCQEPWGCCRVRGSTKDNLFGFNTDLNTGHVIPVPLGRRCVPDFKVHRHRMPGRRCSDERQGVHLEKPQRAALTPRVLSTVKGCVEGVNNRPTCSDIGVAGQTGRHDHKVGLFLPRVVVLVCEHRHIGQFMVQSAVNRLTQWGRSNTSPIPHRCWCGVVPRKISGKRKISSPSVVQD